jgi:hypothetical protein
MGNIFSGDNQTATSNDYVKPSDLSQFVKQSDLSQFAKQSDLSQFAKQSDLSQYAKTTDIPSGNYLAYTNSNKDSINLSSDYLNINDKTGKLLTTLKKTGTMNINTTNQVPFTFNSPNQKYNMALQAGNDSSGDFIRFGQVTLNDDETIKNQQPFIRMDVSPNDTDPGLPSRRVLIRAPTFGINGNINIGSDAQYYQMSKKSNFPVDPCLYMNYIDTTVTPNINKQVGKWCPQDGIVTTQTTTV